MLNELLQAANAIPELPPTLHGSLKSMPSSHLPFKVLIDDEGNVASIVACDGGNGLRKWQPGTNGSSTPAFNTPALFSVSNDVPPGSSKDEIAMIAKAANDEFNAAKKDAALWPSYFATIKIRCNSGEGSWFKQKENGREVDVNFVKSLVDVPACLLSILPDDSDSAVLRTLIGRLQRTKPECFFNQMAQQLEAQLSEGYNERLFALYCARSASKTSGKYNLMLDITDHDLIGDHPVVHEHTTRVMNKAIAQAQSHDDTSVVQDAYGRNAMGADKKFSDVNVLGFGKVILRTMSEEAPCQRRYGTIDAESFRVGAESRACAKSALEYMTDPSRRGKTWQFRSQSLFLFYPETTSPALSEASIADLCSVPGFGAIGDDDDNEDGGGKIQKKAVATANFEARAKRVVDALDGSPRESKTVVHIIVLRKPDEHRVKLTAHHTFKAAHFIEAAHDWKRGTDICPPIAFARWGEKKGQRNDIVPTTPFPSQVVKWLNTTWKRNGEPFVFKKKKPKTFSSEDALTLLLANDGTQIQMSRCALHHALSAWQGLLITVGALTHCANGTTPQDAARKNGGDSGKTKDYVIKAADKRAGALSALPSILTLLLIKSESTITTQEHIMHSPAFLVGRLLALADDLHFQYCQGVRKGHTPGQLLGNALMPTALETPEVALAICAQRIMPYQAWAKTSSADEYGPGRRAKHLLAQLGEVSAEINLADLPKRARDTDKAQIILGYLAKTPSKTEPQSNQPNVTLENQA